MNNKTIAFIGGGNMARALVAGLVASGMSGKDITIVDRNEDKRTSLQQDFSVQTTENIDDVMGKADVYVLAVKPKGIVEVAKKLASMDMSNTPVFISVAAGVTSATINQALNGKAAVVRCMPNTPSFIQHGASGLFANDKVNEEQHGLAESILRAVGITVWVEQESDLEKVTAVSGSGPAYFFLFMESMMDAAIKQGLNEQDAKLLTLQTAVGAAKLAMVSGEDLKQLRRNVTSPGGATEQAVNVFEERGLREIVAAAMEASRAHASAMR